MNIKKTAYNPNLRTPDSIRITIGTKSKLFLYPSEKEKAKRFIVETWKNSLFPEPAYVYYNIDWDCDNILYCKYEQF